MGRSARRACQTKRRAGTSPGGHCDERERANDRSRLAGRAAKQLSVKRLYYPCLALALLMACAAAAPNSDSATSPDQNATKLAAATAIPTTRPGEGEVPAAKPADPPRSRSSRRPIPTAFRRSNISTT